MIASDQEDLADLADLVNLGNLADLATLIDFMNLVNLADIDITDLVQEREETADLDTEVLIDQDISIGKISFTCIATSILIIKPQK